MSISDLLNRATRSLSRSQSHTPRLDVEILAAHALGLDRLDLVTRRHIDVSPAAASTLAGLLKRRRAGEPVARILGIKEFWSLPFVLTERALVPRPETELIVERAIGLVREGILGKDCRILDLGTGSGCILLAILHELEEASGVGVDIDPDATATASVNASRLGLQDRAEFRAADWREAMTGAPEAGSFDLIVANPPYVPTGEIDSLKRDVRDYDPLLALDGGPDGLEAFRQIFDLLGVPRFAACQLLIEIGAEQLRDVQRIAAGHNWRVNKVHRDLAGIERVAECYAVQSFGNEKA